MRARTWLAVLLALALPHGCGDGRPAGDGVPVGPSAPRDFPAGFLFGAATAGFQSDMGCPTLPPEICDDTRSDWYQYVRSPEMIDRWYTFLSGQDPSRVGPGHWELYETDFALSARECRFNAFRMSIEWSRIFPASTVGIEGYEALRAAADPRALAHYHAVFASLRDHGLVPLVTLHHYTLPVWIHDGVGCHLDPEGCTERGWLDPEVLVPEIAKYAGFVAREFGREVDLWGTLNEPFGVLLSAFLLPTPVRTNPPVFILATDAFRTAYAGMVDAHARMYDAVKENDRWDRDGDGVASRVGVIYAVAPVAPRDPSRALDRQAAENVFYLWNMAYLNATALGVFDADFDGEGEFREDLYGRMDFLGMNYKLRIRVGGLPFSILPDLSPLATFDPLSLDLGDVYPRGIYEMSVLLEARLGVPVIVTENNGQSVPEGDMEAEIRHVAENLQWLARAVEEGVDVRGYFYWSLTDNYEWNHGMDVRLGIYRVDPDDPAKTRTPRETVELLRSVAAGGRIPPELADRYPISDPPSADRGTRQPTAIVAEAPGDPVRVMRAIQKVPDARRAFPEK